jgi:hypothetical protein
MNYRPEAVPRETDGFVAHVNAALVQQVLHISKRQRKTDVEHNREADDFGAFLKNPKGGRFVIGND